MAEPHPDATTPGQVPCPDCGQALALPIAAVLSGQPIVCAACGLELHVKREDSAEALAALGRWYEETAPARAAAVASAAAPQPEPRRRPRRSRS